MTDHDERMRVALHEAGHCVAGWVLDKRRAATISIVPNEFSNGRVMFLRRTTRPAIPPVWPPGFPITGLDARSRRRAEVSMIVSLAGRACEEAHARQPVVPAYADPHPDLSRGTIDDETRVEQMALGVTGAPHGLIGWLRAVACQLVRHPRFLALLRPLVAALLERDELTWPQVKAILLRAERDYTTEKVTARRMTFTTGRTRGLPRHSAASK